MPRIEYAGGDYYVGDVNFDDKPHGKGTYFWASGEKYSGSFEDGCFQGLGVRTYANGER